MGKTLDSMKWVVSLCFMFLVSGAYTQQSMSFEEALERAMDNNRGISSARYGVDAALSEYHAARGLRAPQVGLIGSYTLMQRDMDIDLGGAKGVVTESLEDLINKGVEGGLISPTILNRSSYISRNSTIPITRKIKITTSETFEISISHNKSLRI